MVCPAVSFETMQERIGSITVLAPFLAKNLIQKDNQPFALVGPLSWWSSVVVVTILMVIDDSSCY